MNHKKAAIAFNRISVAFLHFLIYASSRPTEECVFALHSTFRLFDAFCNLSLSLSFLLLRLKQLRTVRSSPFTDFHLTQLPARTLSLSLFIHLHSLTLLLLFFFFFFFFIYLIRYNCRFLLNFNCRLIE
jgi:hypothetical protein